MTALPVPSQRPEDEPDTLAAVLDDVHALLGRFVALPSDAAGVAVTLWAAHAHAVDAFDSSPRLALLSPEPGSGKTRTLEILELVTPEPMNVLNASSAAVFRTITAGRPTLLFDEVDAVFGRNGKEDPAEDLRALINAGHRRGATIPRCVGPRHDVQHFEVFAAMALAGLGDLPDTVMSRSVIVRMRRRAPDEKVQPFRRRAHGPAGEELRDRLAVVVGRAAEDLADAWPDMPAGVVDRPADVWEPLLAVADAAGGDWPDRARIACVELCRVAASRDASLGVKLLTDLRDVFGAELALPTETVLDRLHKLDESPWNDLRGRPLDARGLARRLRQYEVLSANVRAADGRVLKGYHREQLWDAWTRYLPRPAQSAASATSATPQVTAPDGVAAPGTPSATPATGPGVVGSGCSGTGHSSATDETTSDQACSGCSGCSAPTGWAAPTPADELLAKKRRREQRLDLGEDGAA